MDLGGASTANPGTGFDERIQQLLNDKTKPQGSLGQLESLAAQLARIQGTEAPRADTCALTIFAADHGITAEGVSAYPQEVTRQMVANLLAGGAAANVMAIALGATVSIVDAGVAGSRLSHPELMDHWVGPGTNNSLHEPAMSKSQFEIALAHGRRLGAAQTSHVCCFGEMGIGNTSAAALVSAKVLGRDGASFVGPGTGLSGDGLLRKKDVLARASARTTDQLGGVEALCEYGGFEIVMMTGAMLGAVAKQRIVLVDGFIASTAALCAQQLQPDIMPSLVFSHRSAEPAHTLLLEAMEAQPLLDLGLRLGEGTGALLAWPLVKAAAAMLREMASFSSAGISGPA